MRFTKTSRTEFVTLPYRMVRQGFSRWSLLFCLVVVALVPAHANASQTPNPRRALVLEPFGSEIGDALGTGQDVVRALQQAGFAVTVKRDGQVTVPLMRNLARYSFVYISTHAGPLPDNDAAIATGDTRQKPYAPYLVNYTLAQMRISRKGVKQLFDAVTGLFIRVYDGKFSKHTIIFLNTCNALDMPLFWKFLKKSGVGTLISWHHHVASGDADRAAESMFRALGDGYTVAQAVSITTSSGAGTSLVGKKIGWLSFSGEGSNSLYRAAVSKGPTPSPIPSPTLTPIPG
jgi:hypothetical protein